MPPLLMDAGLIEKARAFRLDDLLADKLAGKKFMICPVHKEKHEVFM